ncbi:MAG TPA: hypothetical protein VKQ05_14800 [Gemmatimonadales bacterium]|nr:hypothetical protein [Gemmatimonadales bacterium]
MTRNNWIALAVLTSVATFGACSPKGGQAGQPDRTVDQQNTARDRSTLPVSLTVPAGTHVDMTVNQELSSRKNKPGDTFTANVAQDITDAAGTVVIPNGSKVNGSIVAVKPAPNRRTPGTLTVALSTIEANGKTFPIRATIDSVNHQYERQSINGSDAAKVGIGVAAGAVIGQVLSKNTKGTVIGAVVGGIAGAGVAAETKDMDIVIPDGSHITATVTEPMTVAVDRGDLQKQKTRLTKSRMY